MKNEFLVRHGDLLIKKIDKLPDNLNIQKDNIVMRGEFTGHHHTLVCDELAVFTDINGNKYIDLKKDSAITHQEHKTLELPQGYYEVIIEKEFDPFEKKIRQVKD